MENSMTNLKTHNPVIINHHYLDAEHLSKLVPDSLKPQIEKYLYNRVITLKSDGEIILDIISSNTMDNLEEDYFTHKLNHLPYFNYESLLFFTTVCFKHTDLNRAIDFDKKFNHTSYNEFFKNTFGYIVYHHQLEHFYCMITGADKEEAVLFRKNWNKKKNREDAKKLLINHSFSLYDLLIERCFDNNQFVYTPNFSAAYKLWNEFK